MYGDRMVDGCSTVEWRGMVVVEGMGRECGMVALCMDVEKNSCVLRL